MYIVGMELLTSALEPLVNLKRASSQKPEAYPCNLSMRKAHLMEDLGPHPRNKERRLTMEMGWRDKSSFEEDSWGCWRAPLAYTSVYRG